MGRLSLPFRLRGSDGVVHASVTVNDDPSRYGYDLLNLPFPVDTAYGFPVASATVAWCARAFLTATPDCLMTRVIEPVTGFTWGYDRDGNRIDVRGPETVVDEDWRLVRDALARVLPRWELR